MGLTEKDLINELEQRISSLEDQLTRVPARPANEDGVEALIMLARVDEVGGVAAIDADFQVDNIDILDGEDPRVVPGSATEELTAENTKGQVFDDNEIVVVIQNHGDDKYYAFKLGGGSSLTIWKFVLTADLTIAGTSATANVLGDDGTPASPAVPINVVDTEGVYQGFTAYTGADGTAQTGFTGLALKFTDDYAATGNPGAHILEMEGLVPAVLVALAADASGSGAQNCDLVSTSVPGFGSNNCGRVPKDASGAWDVDGFNTAGVADDHYENEQFLAMRNIADGNYELVAPVKVYDRVRGDVVGAVDEADATWTVDGMTSIRGLLPSSPLTFTCTPRLDAPDNQNIELDFNRNDGLWYPVSEYNHCWSLRGLPNFDLTENNLLGWKTSGGVDCPEWDTLEEWFKLLTGWGAADDQSIGHDTSGDPEWQDDTDCP